MVEENTMQQTEIGGIPVDWEVVKLGKGVSLLSGHHILAKFCNTEERGTPYLTGPSDFSKGYIQHTKYTEKPSTICQANDILITVKGSGAGTMILADAEYCISRQLMAIRTSTWDVPFVYSLLKQDESLFGASATGLIPGLSRIDILEKYIPLPPLPEQQAIAEALSDADAWIASLEDLIDKKRLIKQGAMQELLTPKVGWEVKTFGEVLTKIAGGGTPSRTSKTYWNGEIPWMTVKDFASFNPSSTQEYISEAGLKNSATRLVKAGSLILATRIALGQIVRYDIDVTINQDLKTVELNDLVTPEYFLFYFRSIADQIIEKGSGSTVLGLSITDLKNFKIHLPSLGEQKDIACILQDMDTEILQLEQKIVKVRQIKQGMMQELLTGRVRLI